MSETIEDRETIQRALNRLRYAASQAEIIKEHLGPGAKSWEIEQALIKIESLLKTVSYSEGLVIEAECALDRLFK